MVNLVKYRKRIVYVVSQVSLRFTGGIDMILRRIIVADDEILQRNVLTKILKKITPETEITACANGKEVYEELQNNGADLVITDICMPVMDGMELIRQISANYPCVKIGLISAYQEFEYAREAIQRSVSDYLIKPFRISDAQKLIDKVSEELERERKTSRQLIHYESMVEEGKKQDRLKLLWSVLNSGNESQTAEEELKGFACPGTIVALRWKVRRGFRQSRAQMSEQQQDQLIAEMINGFHGACFVPREHGLDKTEQKAAVMLAGWEAAVVASQLEKLLLRLRLHDIIFWAGISNSLPNMIEHGAEGFRQAEEVLSFYFFTPETGGIFQYAKFGAVMEMPMISVSAYETDIRQAVRAGDGKRRKGALSELEKVLGQAPYRYPNKIKHRVSSMIMSVLKELDGMIPQADYDVLLNEAYQLFGQCDSFVSLFGISEDLLDRAAGYYMQTAMSYDAVESCISYIKNHLEEDLSLQFLADQVHFHPNYLSTQIKNRMGMSYSSYILSLRMELACKLLTETDLKIADIAGKSGFRDSSYFNRVFRKQFTISPEQYRKVHKKC